MRVFDLSRNWKKGAEIASKAIKKGEVVVCPTDTVYGLLADALNKKAVEKLFEIKKRPAGKPIPIFVRDIKMAKELALIDKSQEVFLREVWPGRVTAVLKRKSDCGLPKVLFGRRKTIGLRIPDYQLINFLLERLNRPLTGTSANISSQPASTKIEEILNQFKNEGYEIYKIGSYGPIRIAEGRAKQGQGRKRAIRMLILDIGCLPKSFPSAIIDLTKKEPKILR